MFYVYMIESLVDSTFYKGATEDYVRRLSDHNNGRNTSTLSRIPWKLVYVAEFATKQEALKEEKRLKRCNKTYLRWLLTQPTNLIHTDASLSRLA